MYWKASCRDHPYSIYTVRMKSLTIFSGECFAPINISLLPFCDGNNTDSFLTIQFWTKTMKKARTESSKNREKKSDPKNRNGKILRTCGPYIFWPKLLKSVQILYARY